MHTFKQFIANLSYDNASSSLLYENIMHPDEVQKHFDNTPEFSDVLDHMETEHDPDDVSGVLEDAQHSKAKKIADSSYVDYQRFSLVNKSRIHGLSKVFKKKHYDEWNGEQIPASEIKDADRTILEVAKHPIGQHVSLFSRVRYNPKKRLAENKTNILHSPTHLSMSHDLSMASDFSEPEGTTIRHNHIMHVKMTPKDKGFYVGKHWIGDEGEDPEYQTILPAGTKLKYHHTTSHKDGDNKICHVHHFSVHDQSELSDAIV